MTTLVGDSRVGGTGAGPTGDADGRSPEARIRRLAEPGTVRVAGTSGGAVWATARVRGVECVIFGLDPRTGAGALGQDNCAAILAAYEHALEARVPIVGLWHSGGARLQDGVVSLDAVSRVFAAMTGASGRIPQISVVLGAAAGGAAYGPALTDVIVMAPAATVFITGPDIVRSVTGEQVGASDLGGPDVHGRRSGVAHVVTDTEEEAYQRAAALVELTGKPVSGRPSRLGRASRGFGELLPEQSRRAYDMRPVVTRLLDDDAPAVELHAGWARNILTVLGRLDGASVGVVANNPLRKGGCLDALAAEKAARFVRMCDALGIPLVVLVDVPGYLPGVAEEWDGVVRRGAKLLHAFAEATVPRVTVIVRKAYGGAYIAMNSSGLGADHVMAWPEAEIAVMGAVPAVRLLHRRELASVSEAERPGLEERLVDEHTRRTGDVRAAVAAGVVQEVIRPDDTRTAVIAALARCHRRRGAHTNIPL